MSAVDLRLGDWRTVLADVGEVDALITDPPYSERTHDGQSDERADFAYASWSPTDVVGFVKAWAPRTRGWFAAMTDDALAPTWRASFESAGRYAFAAVPVLQHRPRLQGDGPGSGTVWMMVSRPKAAMWMSWGSLPCWYLSTTVRGAAVLGAKPLGLMQAIIRDYSRPGDLVVDPCCGGATTLIAAAIEGRRAVGAELDPVTYAKAMARIQRGHTPNMFAGQS